MARASRLASKRRQRPPMQPRLIWPLPLRILLSRPMWPRTLVGRRSRARPNLRTAESLRPSQPMTMSSRRVCPRPGNCTLPRSCPSFSIATMTAHACRSLSSCTRAARCQSLPQFSMSCVNAFFHDLKGRFSSVVVLFCFCCFVFVALINPARYRCPGSRSAFQVFITLHGTYIHTNKQKILTASTAYHTNYLAFDTWAGGAARHCE